jgi:hypothetical protein
MKNFAQAVARELFSAAGLNVFAVLDGASVPNLPAGLRQLQAEHVCLYRGELKPDVAAVAPYLVHLQAEARLTELLLTQGWGNHWGVFARSHADLRTLRGHFRAFLTVYDTQGKPMLFRYYDPRVLPVYLPTCDARELATVFGPVESYLLEADDPNTLLTFYLSSGALREERKDLGGAD